MQRPISNHSFRTRACQPGRVRVVAQLLLTSTLLFVSACHRPDPVADFPLPPEVASSAADSGEQIAVLAGGCFWGVENVFEHVKGVRSVESGYAGGSEADARYERVGSGSTGHAEAVRIAFDPAQISYGQLLQVFFSVTHDPTQVGRQGPDRGPQYRSEVFAADAAQAVMASAYIARLDTARIFRGPVATRVSRLAAFFPAEALHQDYALRNPNDPYIVYHDVPRVRAAAPLP